MELLTRRQLLATGYSGDEIDRMAESGALVRVRRGVHASATGQPGSPEEEHVRRVRAVVAASRSDHAVSHVSAAVVRAVPVPTDALGRVHLTREREGGGKRRGDVCIHTSPLPASDVGTHSGLLVTTPARTFVDVARRLPTGWAVALGDQVRRQGTSADEVEQVLDRTAGWPGVGRARRADGPTERDVRGWEDVVWAEKVREDLLRDLGWFVVRWTWDDLWRPGLVATRVQRAFERDRRSRTR